MTCNDIDESAVIIITYKGPPCCTGILWSPQGLPPARKPRSTTAKKEQPMLHSPAALATPLPRRGVKGFSYRYCVPGINLLQFRYASHVVPFIQSTFRNSCARDGAKTFEQLSTRLISSKSGSLSSVVASPTNTNTIRTFSSSPVTMVASKIDGAAIAKDIREGLKSEIEKYQQTNPRFVPNLVIFQGRLLCLVSY